MKKFIDVLKNTQLFSKITENEILSMLSCLDARLGEYKKGEYVFHEGEKIESVALLLSGALHIQSDDYWGNRTIVSRIDVLEMFGEAYISSDGEPMHSDAVATEDSTVIFLNPKRIMTTCSAACPHHSLMVQNLFFAISEKNRRLVRKLGHISKRSTREKLISYLSDEAKRHQSSSFTIPFNRQELADYLSVDRSAMSNELCKMRDEGLIEFERSAFKLLQHGCHIYQKL